MLWVVPKQKHMAFYHMFPHLDTALYLIFAQRESGKTVNKQGILFFVCQYLMCWQQIKSDQGLLNYTQHDVKGGYRTKMRVCVCVLYVYLKPFRDSSLGNLASMALIGNIYEKFGIISARLLYHPRIFAIIDNILIL